jgi:hypothetical protein
MDCSNGLSFCCCGSCLNVLFLTSDVGAACNNDGLHVQLIDLFKPCFLLSWIAQTVCLSVVVVVV